MPDLGQLGDHEANRDIADRDLRIDAHRGIVVLSPHHHRTELRLISNDGKAELNAAQLRTLIGLLIGELCRVIPREEDA